MKIEGLPVIDADEGDEITVAVRANDLQQIQSSTPLPSPCVAKIDDARVTKNETLVRRGKKWFRYDAPDKQLFKQLRKTLAS